MTTTSSSLSTGRFVTLVAAITVVCLMALKWNSDVLQTLAKAERASDQQKAFWRLCQGSATAKQRIDDFTYLAEEGNTEWRSAALQNLEMAGINLPGRTLKNADFNGTKFEKSQLTDCDLSGTRFDLCDCTWVNFQNSNLDGSQFFKSRLTNADFRGCSMVSANLEQASGQQANFVRAKLTGGYLPMARLPNADFTGADLAGANLSGATLTNANFALANLQQAVIDDVDFSGANWWRARGLSIDQLSNLLKTFPATDEHSEARQRDFKLWKKAFTGE